MLWDPLEKPPHLAAPNIQLSDFKSHGRSRINYTYILSFVNTMDVAEFDRFSFSRFELRLARPSFHETGIFKEDG